MEIDGTSSVYALPGSLTVLGIVVGGFLIMVGARQSGGRVIFVSFVLAFAGPFLVPMIFNSLLLLRWQVVAVLAAVVGLLMLQGVISLVFGRRVADHVVGNLLTSILRGITYPI